ncbi:MAG: hypothetical protein K6T63_05350 [Alicyclobacillus herbarius]|uniref:hypothetical protein n=1 Tax=Alicyclobacillus herbarius TaxID=122960 RepID=UPI00040BD827|nr:hypothetical protein [Alicyclobacillus herbarius]MCL6632042.1 hypothetical protein [Alicyclobacillus herbarius]
MVSVQLGAIHSGGWIDNVGIFTGQNIQNAWDSHSPTTVAFGVSMGDANRSHCHFAWVQSRSIYGQPIYDGDWKGNHSPLTIGT